jgi:predicted amidohydrolase
MSRQNGYARRKERGAVLPCFPETDLLGWVNPDAHRLASPNPARATERLQAMAREHGIQLAIGLAEKAGEQLHDSAILIDRDGRSDSPSAHS